MCTTKPSSLQDLKVKIFNVISGITVNQLANVFCKLRNCITLSIANDGGNVETLLKYHQDLKKSRFSSFQFCLQIVLSQIQIKL